MQSNPVMNHLPRNPTLRHENVLDDGGVIDVLGVGLQRLFMIWNRAYKPVLMLAPDDLAAREMAVVCKHMRRAGSYRRFEDVTDRALAGDERSLFGDPDTVAKAIAMDKPGMIVREGDDAYLVSEDRIKIA